MKLLYTGPAGFGKALAPKPAKMYIPGKKPRRNLFELAGRRRAGGAARRFPLVRRVRLPDTTRPPRPAVGGGGAVSVFLLGLFQNLLGDLAAAAAAVHGLLLDHPVGGGLGHAPVLDQKALGPV